MILDTNHNTTGKLDQLKQLGYTHLIRYIATADKSITASEARAIANAGILLATVYEAWGDTKNELSSALGIAHAQEYIRKAPLIGQPFGSAMYFAVDSDQPGNEIQNQIVPYFRSIKAVIGTQYRIGVYGPGSVCAALLDAGLVELAWLANATGWSGFNAFKASGRWNILQHLPKTIAGLDTDPDEINPARPDIGAFVPFGAVAPGGPVTELHDARWLQARLNAAGANPRLAEDGSIGALTLAAMIAYVEKQT
jgi:hypothetical protein